MSRLQTFVALTITMVWAVLYIRAAVDRSFTAPAEINAVVLVAVGAILGAKLIQARQNGNGNGKEKE